MHLAVKTDITEAPDPQILYFNPSISSYNKALVERVELAPIPSATPNWHGVKEPNYEILYTQYTEPLFCGKEGLNIGVFGYYYWISHLVSSASNLRVAWKRLSMDRKSDKFTYPQIINGVATFIFNITTSVFAIRAAARCSSKSPFDQAEIVAINQGGHYSSTIAERFQFAFIPGSVFAAVGSFAVSCRPWSPTWVLISTTSLGIVCKFFSPSMFYYGYANFLYVDGSMALEVFSILGPILIIFVTLLAIIPFFFNSTLGRYSGVLRSNPVVKWLLACLVTSLLLFYIWTVGMGFTLLGRSVNDTWGSYVIFSAIGETSIVLASVSVPIAIITAIFSESWILAYGIMNAGN
ncbi:hypothetical protein N431DRAFT_449965 [Stipitochalara longipes BDJ]|nr:hypothetical protein N431DRAFT_449965 [Stipitochalara longipes BDJ]